MPRKKRVPGNSFLSMSLRALGDAMAQIRIVQRNIRERHLNREDIEERFGFVIDDIRRAERRITMAWVTDEESFND